VYSWKTLIQNQYFTSGPLECIETSKQWVANTLDLSNVFGHQRANA
jgi:hypothetical protein